MHFNALIVIVVMVIMKQFMIEKGNIICGIDLNAI
jgi:hypothetical protein